LEVPPDLDLAAKLVDHARGCLVLLLFAREPFAFVEDEGPLLRFALALPRLRDRRHELRAPPRGKDLLGGLSLLVELPMPGRLLVRRIENRPFEERIGHWSPFRKESLRSRDPTVSLTPDSGSFCAVARQPGRLPCTAGALKQ